MPKKSKKNEGLSVKRERFCQEYVIDFNGTKAAERAKYSKNSAGQQAARLLQNDKVKERIRELKKEIMQRSGVTQDMIINEYKKLAFTNSEDVFNWETELIECIDKDGNTFKKEVSRPFLKKIEEMSDAARASISEIRETAQGLAIKLHDKKGALDSLSRCHNMFSEKIEHSGPNGGAIETKFTVEFVETKSKDQ